MDLTRLFSRALRRAGLQVVYSEGFNPHPRISFGPPLPVGVESEREYVDIDFKDIPGRTAEEILAETLGKLRNQLPEGIVPLECALLLPGSRALTAVINLAVYLTVVSFLQPLDFERIKLACMNWLAKEEAEGIRHAKGKERTRNIRPFVRDITVLDEGFSGNQAGLRFYIRTGNQGSVRPEEILDSLKELEGLPIDPEGIFTVREGLYIMDKDEKLLDPLKTVRV